jgi:Na+-transporting NADH:ubiquinone oxidoreductase subunit B
LNQKDNMKGLRKILDNIKPHFEEGGKLSFLHSVYDGLETFAFVPNHTTKRGETHIRDGIDLKRTMFIVVIALIPALLFGMFNAGHQHFLAIGETVGWMDKFLFGAIKIMPIVAVSYIVGLGIEFAFCQVKGHPINEGFLVSGILIPLVMPPDISLGLVALATAFAVIVGKEVFGGTGMNILNPALTARVFLYVAKPLAMVGDSVWIAADFKTKGVVVEGITGATSLGELAAQRPPTSSIMEGFIGLIPGSIGETSVLMCLIGAVILIATGVGSWRIMLSTFSGGLFMALILNAFQGNPELEPGQYSYLSLPALQHLVIGGFAFGAIFMATDPVSGAQTTRGKWIYGFLIGVITILVRLYNPGFPEGIMMAILLMNVFAPLIDHFVIESNLKKRMKRVKV